MQLKRILYYIIRQTKHSRCITYRHCLSSGMYFKNDYAFGRILMKGIPKQYFFLNNYVLKYIPCY